MIERAASLQPGREDYFRRVADSLASKKADPPIEEIIDHAVVAYEYLGWKSVTRNLEDEDTGAATDDKLSLGGKKVRFMINALDSGDRDAIEHPGILQAKSRRFLDMPGFTFLGEVYPYVFRSLGSLDPPPRAYLALTGSTDFGTTEFGTDERSLGLPQVVRVFDRGTQFLLPFTNQIAVQDCKELFDRLFLTRNAATYFNTRNRFDELVVLSTQVPRPDVTSSAAATDGGSPVSRDAVNYALLVQTNINRFGPILMIMVLVGILVPLYRYSMRLSAFYFARADLMRFMASAEEPIDIDILARALTPSFNFGKEAVLPTQHVTEIVRDLVKAAGDRAGRPG